MSKTKHTAGPWVAWDRGIGWEVHHSFDPETGHGIAINDQFRETLKESDARLIAAAPDLLAALEAMLGRYVELVNSGDAGSWDPENEDEVKQSRAAIAKSEGREAVAS